MNGPSVRIIFCFIVALSLGVQFSRGDDDDHNYEALEVVGKSAEELLVMRGFRAKHYTALTRDGYLLDMMRIIHPDMSAKERNNLKRPVLFVHGFNADSTEFLVNAHRIEPALDDQWQTCAEGPLRQDRQDFKNGPMLLANFGYDVWLMTMRGLEGSLGHRELNSTNSTYWNFSLDELSLNDLPAAIKCVQRITGRSKMGVIGHSLGGMAILALLAERPHYSEILEPVGLISPAGYIAHLTSVVRLAVDPLLLLSPDDQNGPFPPPSRLVPAPFGKVCTKIPSYLMSICRMARNMIGGKGVARPKKGHYSFWPKTASLKAFRHFAQLIKNKRFAKYSYKTKRNLELYGQPKSPVYHVERIRSKSISLFSSRSDAFVRPLEMNILRRKLRHEPIVDVFIDGDFNHFDLVLDDSAASLIFRSWLIVLESFEKLNGICAKRGSNKKRTSKSMKTKEDSQHDVEKGMSTTTESMMIEPEIKPVD